MDLKYRLGIFTKLQCPRCDGTGEHHFVSVGIACGATCPECKGSGVMYRHGHPIANVLAATVAHVRAWYETTDPIRFPLPLKGDR